MATAELSTRRNAPDHIADTSAILLGIGNHLRHMPGEEFRREALLLARDEHLSDRLLQLILGEAESRGACLAHEIMRAAKAQSVDPQLAFELDQIEATSPGA